MRSIISKNKIYIIVCFTTMLVMLLTALNDTNIFYIVIKINTNQSFRENYTLAESNIKYNISLYSVIVQILTDYTWNYNIMLIWALNIFQIFLPLFSAIACLYYYQKKKTVFQLSLHKSNKYTKFIVKETIKDAHKMSLSAFIGYLAFFALSLIISKCSLNHTVTRTFLIDIVGSNFYNNHQILYYLITGFLKLYIINFVYILFSLSLIEMFNIVNNKFAFLLPLIWYYSAVLLSSALTNGLNASFIYLSPALIMMSDYYNSINTYKIFALPLLLFFISIFNIRKAGSKNEL